MSAKWLEFTQRLQAIAQNGLTYAENPFDIERYQHLRDLAVEMAACYGDSDPEVIRKLFTSDKDYVTPKVDTRGVIFQDGAVLLVRERSDGLWTVPGGWADIGDSPAEATEREVLEESGYQARATRLLAVYDRNKHDHPPHPHHIYKLFFLCELTGGEAQVSVETTGVGFFPVDNLPPLSIARVTAKQITRFYALASNPDIPADFD